MELSIFTQSKEFTVLQLYIYIYDISVINKLLEMHCDIFLFISVLCSDRVTQMTKTYNDIEAVNRLLEEVTKNSKDQKWLILLDNTNIESRGSFS